jgi:integrative and conjugative element protein (TIGR02256 family)
LRYYYKNIGLNIEIQDKLLNELYAVGLNHYQKEFGGLLIGKYSDDFKTCIIETTVLPVKYKSSKYSFERGKAGLKGKLTEFYNSEPRLFYVGEWHTHPDSLAIPSSKDKSAMKEIEDNSDVNITSPLLLIIGLNNGNYHTGFYIQHNKVMYEYEK